MGRVKKSFAAVAALWACMLAFAAAAPADAERAPAAASGETQARRYLEDVNQVMLSVESYHMEAEILLHTDAWGRVAMHSVGDLMGIPAYRYRSDWDVTYEGPFAQESRVFHFQQYLEEVGDQLVAYVGTEGVWHSVPFAITAPSNATRDVNWTKRTAKARIEDAKLKGYDFIKHIALRKQDEGKTALDITLDMRRLADATAAEMERLEKLAEARAPKKADGKKQRDAQMKKRVLLDAKAMQTVLAKTGEFSYTLQVDDATKQVVRMDAEMTEFLHAFVGAFAEFAQMPPQDRAQLEEAMRQLKVQFTMRMSAFNAVEPFEVPQEVRKNAKPLVGQRKI